VSIRNSRVTIRSELGEVKFLQVTWSDFRSKSAEMGRSVEGRDRRGAGGSRTGGQGRSAAWHVRVLGGGDLAPGGYYQKVNEKLSNEVVLELQEMGGWRVRVEVRNGRAVKLHAAQADRLCYSALRAPRRRRRVTCP